ncbi:hypothetical protein [Sporisorium scitamineum]|uniref:Uncharacterized protein n=1 Tax=Sporisorium scitamineum TaxID=49012 RepID=A0A0F7RTS0_9BASI|nr:hypothetical protein [Sporisorium scitamineum]
MSIKQRFSALSLALALVLASLQVVQVAADDQVICTITAKTNRSGHASLWSRAAWTEPSS